MGHLSEDRQNIFKNLNFSSKFEIVDEFFKNEKIRVERILSSGQTTKWQDNDEDEWVCLLDGEAKIRYENGDKISLNRGDTLFIKAHTKHQVSYTSQECIWLCFFSF
ncbi:cupin domain-containing protein [Campylobacter sp. RM9344]|uniref:Cupin domain-containing protein n=1 Tax=Campylobacter californiensis TaxID=1032243 RepID=A0AAW3ZXG6_9BACT|nr:MULTISPECIES: cupin domain-containing protein [unclassified Campylobacter]MBE2983985.1 cupin domain-containing protein [Campylobacter sp. RM6883]MBE2986147.1 cupin domain-containing protein [Campylobacter sp. RM12919]MBE2987559.1 cupin domain-containing protein [Campylobacter sp. RM12920]MBE2994523.1 cupin domain-containing protein [Campylobacter sp. RM6913]MBE3022517.1 cupin domain-containing protein [Campylobacter sp. 7477a]MBE3030092.1 cupin domain-containing protein [Campylobacter sp. 